MRKIQNTIIACSNNTRIKSVNNVRKLFKGLN
jgi:hypothetical protein